jgi:hypothetical protein
MAVAVTVNDGVVTVPEAFVAVTVNAVDNIIVPCATVKTICVVEDAYVIPAGSDPRAGEEDHDATAPPELVTVIVAGPEVVFKF